MSLVLQFLGVPQLYLDGRLIGTDRRKAIALLAYLTVNDLGHPPQRYSRQVLSSLLWPDYEQAKAFSNLRRIIWEVRQAAGDEWLIIDRDSVQLNADAQIDLDVARFQDLLLKSSQQKKADLRIPLLIDSVELYRNHFLTGFSLKDAHAFNDWAFAVSEELSRKFAGALTLLVESYCTLGQADTAIPYARRLTKLDPLNESGHRQLMQVYDQAGQHNAALKQYQICEKILRKELGLDPQPETRELYKLIRKRGNNQIQSDKQKPISSLAHINTLLDSEENEKERHSQLTLTKTWKRLKRPLLLLGVLAISIFLWKMLLAAIPAGTVMPFPQKDGMKLHYVPFGSFLMGSEETGYGEMPIHKVTLDAYWIDETEITNSMYARCVKAGICQPPTHNSSAKHKNYYDNKLYADYPVVYVSWNDANTYCQWAGRALPSEAQWEKAARGTDERTYPWGNEMPNNGLLNFNANIGDTTEVGIYLKGNSPYGTYDMAGNVWEWVGDWYDSEYYARSPSSNPLGPSSGHDRVVRGGAWGINDCGHRATDRCSINPDASYADLGFRCALSSSRFGGSH